MARSLLASQFADLEPLTPTEHGFSVDGDQELATVVTDVIRGLRAFGTNSLRGRGRIS
jgi:gluconate kinase